MYTADAGESWEPRNPAGMDPAGLLLSPGVRPMANAAFQGTGAAWFAAASPGAVTVSRTVDAGRHWSTETVHPGTDVGFGGTDTPMVLGLGFPSETDGYLLATAGGIAAGVEDIELYGTANGGKSWKALGTATQQETSPTGLSAEGAKTGLGFAVPGRGWITGYRGTQPGMWLYETDDGGKAWHTSALPTPPRFDVAGSPQTFPPLFTGPDAGILPVTWPGSPSNTVFYVTDHGGDTWRPTAPIVSPDPMQIWDWTDATHAAAANDTTWCETDAGGQSWHCRPLPAELAGITDLDLVTPKLGWAVAAGHLSRTTDGGHTWIPVAARVAQ
jgi:photosystem II stability/assembly factor-like uncharacterized protein